MTENVLDKLDGVESSLQCLVKRHNFQARDHKSMHLFLTFNSTLKVHRDSVPWDRTVAYVKCSVLLASKPTGYYKTDLVIIQYQSLR